MKDKINPNYYRGKIEVADFIYSFLAGLFDDLGDMTLGAEIFVDEQPDYYSFAQETTRRTGPELIAEAKEAGFTFD